MIREEEPPRPSTRLSGLGLEVTALMAARQTEVQSLVRQLRNELEWIPLKAMRKEEQGAMSHRCSWRRTSTTTWNSVH